MVKKNTMVKKIKNVSDEEKILGETAEFRTVEIFDYESPDITYKITNYQNNKRVIFVSGKFIETFIGINQNAREALKTGEKKVKIYDNYSPDDEKPLLYLIEVAE